jgi:hypothetical protein
MESQSCQGLVWVEEILDEVFAHVGGESHIMDLFFLKDPIIAGLRFLLVGRIFTEWSNDQGIIKKIIKKKNKIKQQNCTTACTTKAAQKKQRNEKHMKAKQHPSGTSSSHLRCCTTTPPREAITATLPEAAASVHIHRPGPPPRLPPCLRTRKASAKAQSIHLAQV